MTTKETSSTRHPFLTALVVMGLCLLLHQLANAERPKDDTPGKPAPVFDLVLAKSEYQANEAVSGEVRITTTTRGRGPRFAVEAFSESTGRRIYRESFSPFFPTAGTHRVPFTIKPTPRPNDSYKVVVVERLQPKSVIQDTAEFTVHAAQLPFWLAYCADPTCGGLQPLVVQVCPEDNPSCSPRRQTTIVPRVDGLQINQVLLPIEGIAVRAVVISGNGQVLGASLVLSFTSPVILRSDVDITLSHYGVTPIWGGTTHLDFVSSTMVSPEVITTVHRHPTFLVNDEATELHERSRVVIATESEIAGINPGQMRAVFMPTEFVTAGEGNFSDGNRNIFMNYSNPAFIASVGSVFDVVMPRFAHEYVHELFSEVVSSHPGFNICLNEGLADAFAFAAGFLPEQDFGPIGVRATDFNQGCAEIAQTSPFSNHDAGNCPFWQVHRLGLLSQSFVARVLRPQSVITFNSCDLRSARSGNALIVLFSEAAGVDMTAVIQMAEIPNAGSLEAAKQALGP